MGTQRKAPNSGDGLFHVSGEDTLYLVTRGKTDAALLLLVPRSMRRFLKETEPAFRIPNAHQRQKLLGHIGAARRPKPRAGPAGHDNCVKHKGNCGD